MVKVSFSTNTDHQTSRIVDYSYHLSLQNVLLTSTPVLMGGVCQSTMCVMATKTAMMAVMSLNVVSPILSFCTTSVRPSVYSGDVSVQNHLS